jgi:NAD-dependent dihydropyrimidine dehydrogenase PreA subunit
VSIAVRYLRNVATVAVDEALCTGCLACLDVCPRGVLARRQRRVAVADRDACIECGACAANCRYGAITVHSGVGCAAAVVRGLLRGTAPTCDCGGSEAADPGSGACCGS